MCVCKKKKKCKQNEEQRGSSTNQITPGCRHPLFSSAKLVLLHLPISTAVSAPSLCSHFTALTASVIQAAHQFVGRGGIKVVKTRLECSSSGREILYNKTHTVRILSCALRPWTAKKNCSEWIVSSSYSSKSIEFIRVKAVVSHPFYKKSNEWAIKQGNKTTTLMISLFSETSAP